MVRYGLGVILYSVLNIEDIDSTYYVIAKYILKNMDNIKSKSITDFAKECNVSVATVSRFCRKIGLEDFFELKMHIYNSDYISQPRYEFESYMDSDEPIEHQYINAVSKNISQCYSKLNMKSIENLVDDIYKYNNVAVFGTMQTESTALSLQSDLFRCHKIIDTRLVFSKQIEYIEKADSRNLIIIFTLSGNYLRESFKKKALEFVKGKPYIYVVTANEDIKNLKYVDKVILLPTNKQDFAAHPYEMNLVSSLITLKYYNKYVK